MPKRRRSMRTRLLTAFAAVPLITVAPSSLAYATHPSACSPPLIRLEPRPGGTTVSAVVTCLAKQKIHLVLEASGEDMTVLRSETTADVRAMGRLGQSVFVRVPVKKICVTVNQKKKCVAAA